MNLEKILGKTLNKSFEEHPGVASVLIAGYSTALTASIYLEYNLASEGYPPVILNTIVNVIAAKIAWNYVRGNSPIQVSDPSTCLE